MRPEPTRAHRRARNLGSGLLLVVALTAAWTGCGKQGDPLPPPRLIPAPIADLRVAQIGEQLVLSMTYPAVTTSGLPLASVEAIEILTQRAPPTGGGFATVDARAFAGMAQVAARLEAAELAAATEGALLVVALDARPGSAFGPAPAVPSPTPAAEATEPPATEAAEPPAALAGPPPIFIAVRSFGPQGHASPLSNLVSIVPRTPPPGAPASLEAEPSAAGVRLEWTAAAGEPAGYDVLRRRAGERSFGPPVAALGPDATTHVDAAAPLGASYEYTVRTVAARDPLIASADGPIAIVEYLDVFPPPAPANLVALAEQGQVRLVWDRVEAPDLAGYRLYREESAGERVELPREPGAGTSHIDTGVRRGVSYVYRVSAVDRDDNESPPSEPATATPR